MYCINAIFGNKNFKKVHHNIFFFDFANHFKKNESSKTALESFLDLEKFSIQ